jgi:dTDP-4-amino-4,6-dideoxygalactose transaminase
VFSFHATKFFNSFEGGAILTNDDSLAEKIRLMRNFGFHGYDNVIYVGTNGKMTEVCAAMGLTSLESVEKFVEINRRNYLTYQRELAGLGGITLMLYGETRTNYQYIVLEVEESKAGLTRDQLVEVLFAENVLARRYFFPGCHRMEPYRSYFPHASLLLPNTEELCARVLVLPNGESVDEMAISQIGQVIRTAISNADTVKTQLQRLPSQGKG